MSPVSILLTHEAAIRFGVFAGVFVLMAVLEAVFPRKGRTQTRLKRWTTNSALLVVDMIALRVLAPLLAVGAAMIAARAQWGLLHQIALPMSFKMLVAVIALDLLVYGQHIAFHKIPVLWRFHKIHHADRDIDVSTGVRFHPVEILLSMGLKVLGVLALGAPVAAVILFEVLLNAFALFGHANVRLPLRLDALLRLFIVTPDMHRVHHSVYEAETNSNYGTIASFWDRLFRTYLREPQDGHEAMTIGLRAHQNEKPARLAWSLTAPFKGQS